MALKSNHKAHKTMKLQWMLSLIGVGLFILLYQLPRTSKASVARTNKSVSSLAQSEPLPTESNSKLKVFEALYRSLPTYALADSIVRYALNEGTLSRAHEYAMHACELASTPQEHKAAALWLYEIYDRSQENPAVRQTRARDARLQLEALYAAHPTWIDLRVPIALTYLVEPQPMQAITQLRQILSENPKHKEARLQLGRLALMSKQYDKAEKQLKELRLEYPNDSKIRLYSAILYSETKRIQESMILFEQLQSETSDASVAALARYYLRTLQESHEVGRP